MECVYHDPMPKMLYVNLSLALDYPPFFAYFEKLLSIPAYFVDPEIVNLNNLYYDSWSAVVYQRTSVILTELVMAVVLQRYAGHSQHYATSHL